MGRMHRGYEYTGMLARILVVILAVCSIMILGSCSDASDAKAVGNTSDKDTAIAHDSVDKSDILIGFIGSSDANQASAETSILQVCERSGLRASYVSTSAVNDPLTAATQGVEDFVARAATVIVINTIDVSDTGKGSAATDAWNQSLEDARKAGIAVILLDPQHRPDDTSLYAAVFTVDDDDTNAISLDTAINLIVNDNPHEDAMTVTLKR